MHYYQHHIGDFIKDTSFLTNEEVGIYLKLLWLYYDTEHPLPNSLFELSMKVNARDRQDIICGILGMYFTLRNEEWHHTRCDKEISFYKQQLEIASKAGKASAAKRALNRNSTGVERALDSGSTSVQPTSNQQPITNNHKPSSRATKGSRLSTDFVLPEEWIAFCQQERQDLNPYKVFDGFKDYWVAKAGAQGVKLDWLATWRNWVRNQRQERPNPADIAKVTVPSSSQRDPALLKIDEDLKNAKPNPEILKMIREGLKGKIV
jgi:uncharacterized protein YdaU (DUF1376 family)